MNPIQTNNQKDISVIFSDKGQKLVAALYLVTSHVSDRDPLKISIRSKAVALIDTVHDCTECVSSLIALLTVAKMASIISVQNVDIISEELRRYRDLVPNPHDNAMDGYFITTPVHTKQASLGRNSVPPRLSRLSNTSSYQTLHNSKIPHPSNLNMENKNKRQQQILSFINERKSVGIKDISLLITDVSEKTIQRELSALVLHGAITKRGSKRWSIYMAVT